ncbi:hypothetical protein LSH36_174g03055 [Paralvinella palmiformis]|uniref:Uncharacterized protein n=1 Tax=Paralvinella palmiformis TaxID=53620 RepID=A0AAD9JS65_9ANNE|nr:hypothetical protein LSH36_174g03055 [Paralvinella palmiformis]
MANYQLGPESPRPFAVLSENYVHRHVDIPTLPPSELFSFGDDYERRMCELVHKYMELDTDDRLCYVGDPKGSLAEMLQERFCLLEPVTTVVPGHIHYEESPNHRMLPFKVPNVGAEEYFRRAADSGAAGPIFDKILFKDVVPYLDDPRRTYQDALGLLSEFGKLVIVQRPADMLTLPVFAEAKERLTKHERSYLRTIEDLQALRLDVSWDVECLPVVMAKSRWYAMVKERFPPQLEMVSNFEVTSGLRELSEGVLKYVDERIEFVDRLLFISASRPVFGDQLPLISRYGDGQAGGARRTRIAGDFSAQQSFVGEPRIRYEMSVTPDIDELIRDKQRRDRISNGRKGNGRL